MEIKQKLLKGLEEERWLIKRLDCLPLGPQREEFERMLDQVKSKSNGKIKDT